MTEQHMDTNTDNRTVAILKPQYLLGLAIIGLALTIIGGFQPRFGIMGFAGLGILGLSVVTWGIIAPEQLRAAFLGRTARYGGTAFVVTVVLITALIALYVLFRSLDLTFDVTQRDAFSVRPEIRESLSRVVGNPNTPDLQLVTFLTAEEAGLQDRLTLLYEDIQSTTLGKITYRFIDIDLQPLLAEDYGVIQSQQIAVVPLDEAGEAIPAQSNIIPRIDTKTLQSAIVGFATNQAFEGNFGVYFVNEVGGVQVDAADGSGMTLITEDLGSVFRYNTLFSATMQGYRTNEDIQPNNPDLDGETMIIVGGANPLAEEDRLFLQDYLDNGGNMILMAGFNSEGLPNIATDPALTDYLLENYGIAFNNDFVVDPIQNYEGSDALLPNTISTDHFIGQMGFEGDFSAQFLFGFPTSSIQIANTPPDNVIVSPLIPTSQQAYTIPNEQIPAVIQSSFVPGLELATDNGILVLAAAAENVDTGSRIVLLGNDTLAIDNLIAIAQQISVANRELILRSTLWASNFDSRLDNLEQPIDIPLPVEEDLIANDEQIAQMNLILGFVLPFAVLGLGVFVVFLNREREVE